MTSRLTVLAVAALFAPSTAIPTTQDTSTLTATTSDGVTIHGELHLGDLPTSAPLVLLFHQGGSNGRGEYAPLVPWLNRAGYRAIAWDQRAGGETYGSTNRTVAGLPEDTPNGYCDAYADLEAALDAVLEEELAEQVFVWGSSYSAALVFRLAAERPDAVRGVLAFSPASGGPLEDCRARMWVDDIAAPMLVLRPASEMERESSQQQRAILEAAGVTFRVVEHGVHGSSMLVDERTEHDMSEVRAEIVAWIAATHRSSTEH